MKNKFIIFAMLFMGVNFTFAQDSTADLAWDAVSEPVAGYTVFWGTEPGVYPNSQELGDVTQTTLTGLPNCGPLYFCVRARKDDGTLSQNCSNEVDGWGAPTIASITPPQVEQGFTGNITIAGINYMEGATFGVEPGQGVVVNSISRNSCNELVANITVDSSTRLGFIDTEVLNPDRIWTDWVVGQLEIISPTAPSTPTNLRRTEKKPDTP